MSHEICWIKTTLVVRNPGRLDCMGLAGPLIFGQVRRGCSRDLSFRFRSWTSAESLSWPGCVCGTARVRPSRLNCWMARAPCRFTPDIRNWESYFPATDACGFLKENPPFSSNVARSMSRSAIDLNAASGQNLKHTVTLRRRIHMAEKGWWSGDLHAHRDPADMPALMEAADLNFAPTLTHWNDRPLLESWPAQNIYPDAQGRTYSIHNAEDERAWGAALFLNLRSPIRLYRPRSEYPPPTVTWQEARANGAYIDLEKLIWWQAPVITALSIPDSLGLACNHFMEEGMMDAEAWGRPRDRVKYPGPIRLRPVHPRSLLQLPGRRSQAAGFSRVR